MLKNIYILFKYKTYIFLYYHMLPFFESHTFFTRKYEYFQLWVISVKLIMTGARSSPEGRNILRKNSYKYE